MKCYCGSQRSFNACCEPVIAADNAGTPEQLMRSRFTAYCLCNYAYVLRTYAALPRASLSINQLEAGANETQWLGLQMLAASENKVQFVAYFKEQSKLMCMNEISTFVREENKWRYLSGDMEYIGPARLSRNDPCFCGSGQKFKKCCMNTL